jgi:hypothetical protein
MGYLGEVANNGYHHLLKRSLLMKKLVSFFAVSALFTGLALAETPVVPVAATTPTPVVTTPAPAPASIPAAVPTSPVASIPVSGELKDGTKIEIAPDGVVSVVNADGTKTAAPDGMLTLRDGATVVVKSGKKAAE